MTAPRVYSAISMQILEYLIQQTVPKPGDEIVQIFDDERRRNAKYLFSPMTRDEVIVKKDLAGGGHGYAITRKGRNYVAAKADFTLVEAVKIATRPHPDTGEPISVHKHKKLLEERRGEAPKLGRKPKPKPEPVDGALPNVSTNANNLMDNISQVIHENAAYREALLNIGNTIAGLLGMRMMPRE